MLYPTRRTSRISTGTSADGASITSFPAIANRTKDAVLRPALRAFRVSSLYSSLLNLSSNLQFLVAILFFLLHLSFSFQPAGDWDSDDSAYQQSDGKCCHLFAPFRQGFRGVAHDKLSSEGSVRTKTLLVRTMPCPLGPAHLDWSRPLVGSYRTALISLLCTSRKKCSGYWNCSE